MAPWQKEMAEAAREAAWYATLSGANGWCIDEGDEYRPAVFAYSRLDALAVARSGYLGEYAKAHSNSKDIKKQMAVADFLANPDSARAAGVEVQVDVTERQLGKREFFARRRAGVEQLMRGGHYTDTHDAELEWMMREAEMEVGYLRNDPNPARRAAVRKAYRKRCRKDW